MTVRLLMILPSLEPSGDLRQALLLASRLPRDRFEPHLLALRDGGGLFEQELAQTGIPCSHARLRPGFDPAGIARVIRQVRQLSPEIVETWGGVADTVGRFAAVRAKVGTIVSRRRRLRKVIGWLERGWLRRLDRRTDRFLVETPEIADQCLAAGTPAQQVEILPPGIELPAPAPLSKAGNEESPAAQWFDPPPPPSMRLVASAGRLTREAGWEDLLWAGCLLKETRKDIYFAIAGDGPFRAGVEHYRQRVQLSDQSVLLRWQPDTASLLRQADVYCQTSDPGGLSLSLLEALGAGLPCVAASGDATRRLITPGENGLLFPRHDSAEIARCIRDVLVDDALAAQLGAAARQTIAQHYSALAFVARHNELCEELAGG